MDNDLASIADKGYKLVAELTRFSDYISLNQPSIWPNSNEKKKFFEDAMQQAKEIPTFDIVDSKEKLYITQMRLVIISRLHKVASILYHQSAFDFGDYHLILDIKEEDIANLKFYLEEHRDEFGKIIEDKYQNDLLPEYINIPFVQTIYNDLEKQFYSAIDRLFIVAKKYFGGESFLVEKLQRSTKIYLVLSESTRFAAEVLESKIAVFNVNSIASFKRNGDITLDYHWLIHLFAHEILGHGIHDLISDSQEDIPNFVKTGSRRVPTTCVTEEIASLATKDFVDFLQNDHESLKMISESNNVDNLLKQLYQAEFVNRYLKDFEALAFYYCLKTPTGDLPTSEWLALQMGNLLPNSEYYKNFIQKLRTRVGKSAKNRLDIYYFTHSYHGLERLRQEQYQDISLLTILNIIRKGYWSPSMLAKVISSELDKKS